MNENIIVIRELDKMITRCLFLAQNISGCPNEIVQSIGKVKDWTRVKAMLFDCSKCPAWSGNDCIRNPYTEGCLKDNRNKKDGENDSRRNM